MAANGCLSYLFSSKDRKRSNRIDKQLARDKIIFQKTREVLLLGSEGSGKSTILHQIRSDQGEPFYPRFQYQRRNEIRKHLVDAIVRILTAMPSLTPPVSLDSAENEILAKWVLDNYGESYLPNSSELYQKIQILWKDEGVREAHRRGNEYQLTDNTKYFFDRIGVIGRSDYIPTHEDSLRCPVMSNYIDEVHFTKEGLNFRIIDVGHRNCSSRKWLENMSADNVSIMFVVDCSSYDVVTGGDPSRNRLQESFDLLENILRLRFCISVVSVVLNKRDLFKEKILSGSKLEDYLPNFKSYERGMEVVKYTQKHLDVARAEHFIADEIRKIINLARTNRSGRLFCSDHFTCALNHKDIKRFLDDSCSLIVRMDELHTITEIN